MKNTKAERANFFFNAMSKLGFTYEETCKLRRIEMTLSRWSELECGNSNEYSSYAIERDETTGKPFMVIHPNQGKTRQYPVADREKGALKRLAGIMKAHEDLIAYHQGDPRGCALYILRNSDIRNGEQIDSIYNRGICANY